MAEEQKAEAADEGAKAPEAPSAPGPSKLPMLLALVNTLAVLGALGMFVYTRVMFKRPPITEAQERERLLKANEPPKAVFNPGLVHFDAVTINIKPSPEELRASQTQGADAPSHFGTIGFSLELRDQADTKQIENLRARIVDIVLTSVGKRTYAELVTVQGRYVLRSEMLDRINGLFEEKGKPSGPAVVTNLFISQFSVQ